MAQPVARNASTEDQVVETSKAVAAASLNEDGQDERANYYNKWDKFAKEKVEEVEKEEQQEKEEADRQLGIDPSKPMSEAEKLDKEKHEMLKEAKKRWDEKKIKEDMMKHFIEDIMDDEVVLDSEYLKKKPVILIKSSKRSKFKLPSGLGHRVVKLFVEDCEECVFDFEENTITQHTEIAHSKKITVNVRAPLATLQLDLCEEVKVSYSAGMFTKDTKIFHAGVSAMHLETHEGHSHKADYIADGAVATQEKLATEQQFMTRLHPEKGHPFTEKVLRTKGNLPITQTEIDAAAGTNAEMGTTPQSTARSIELKKNAGNECFKQQEYAQAIVHYTEAILEAPSTSPELHKLYGNRAFCLLKLGQHEKAETDARKAIELKPDFVKGHFRLGLALHAKGKYFEALPVLARALELEPKNQQIKEAIGFAEMRARKISQH